MATSSSVRRGSGGGIKESSTDDSGTSFGGTTFSSVREGRISGALDSVEVFIGIRTGGGIKASDGGDGSEAEEE